MLALALLALGAGIAVVVILLAQQVIGQAAPTGYPGDRVSF